MALQKVLSSTELTHGNDGYSTFIKYAAWASNYGRRSILISTWVQTI